MATRVGRITASATLWSSILLLACDASHRAGPSTGGQPGTGGQAGTAGTGGVAGSVAGGGGGPTGPTTLATGLAVAKEIAVTDNAVYFSAYDGVQKSFALFRLAKSGGKPEPIAQTGEVYGLAADSTKLYVHANGAEGANACIFSVPLSGGPISTVVTAPCQVQWMTIDNTNVYWADNAAITVMKVSLSGGQPEVLAKDSSLFLNGLAVTAANAYWSNNSLQIMSVPASGGTPTQVALLENDAFHLEVGGSDLYWTTASGTVAKMALKGGAVTTLATGQNFARSIHADSGNLYWVNADDPGSVMKLAPGSTPVAIRGGLHFAWALAVDSTSIYWTTDDSVMKAAK